MANLYKIFKELTPEPPLLIGKVVLKDAVQCTIKLPDEALIIARGDAVINTNVFVRNGVIEGAAPNLTVELIEV